MDEEASPRGHVQTERTSRDPRARWSSSSQQARLDLPSVVHIPTTSRTRRTYVYSCSLAVHRTRRQRARRDASGPGAEHTEESDTGHPTATRGVTRSLRPMMRATMLSGSFGRCLLRRSGRANPVTFRAEFSDLATLELYADEWRIGSSSRRESSPTPSSK